MNATKPLNFKNTNRPGKRQARLVNYFTRLALTGTLLTAGITTGLSLTSCSDNERPRESNQVAHKVLKQNEFLEYTDKTTNRAVKVFFIFAFEPLSMPIQCTFRIGESSDSNSNSADIYVGETVKIQNGRFAIPDNKDGYYMEILSFNKSDYAVTVLLTYREFNDSGGFIITQSRIMTFSDKRV